MSGGTETIPEDTNTRSTSINIDLWSEQHGKSIYDVQPSFFGHWVVRYSTGWTYAGGASSPLPVMAQRMVGILKGFSNTAGRSLELTVADRWVTMEEVKLWYPPLLHGMRAADAIKLLAQWCWTPLGDIIDDGGPVNIPVPPNGYWEPNWKPENGCTAAEEIRRIKDKLGVRAFFDTNGSLHIKYGYDNTSQATFSTEAGTDDDYALGDGSAISGVALAADMSGVCNKVLVEGKTYDGDPLNQMMEDSIPAQGDPGYLGYTSLRYKKDSDARTQDDINRTASDIFYQRETGRPMVNISSNRGYSLAHLFPGTAITLVDNNFTKLGTALGRVMSVTVNWGRFFHSGSAVIQLNPLSVYPYPNPTPPGPLPPSPPYPWQWFGIEVSNIGGPDAIKPNWAT